MKNTTPAAGDLDKAARALDTAIDATGQATLLLLEGDAQGAEELVRLANVEEQKALRLLTAAGARLDEHAAPATVARIAPIPLHLLDTPDTRELFALVRGAVAVAERVDKARGRALPPGTELQPGETYGTDLAEALSNLAERLRVEVEGPTRARGRE